MPNFPIELSLNDTPVQQMSTTLRRRKRSFSTTSLVKCDNSRSNVVGGSRKNRKTTTLLLHEFQEEEEEEEGESPLEDLIQQLRSELQQTRALVSELETRLELTEQTSQVIVGELKSLLSESESHTTAVEESDDIKIDLDDDDEFCISSPLMNQTYQEEIEIPNIDIDHNEREVTCSNLSSQNGPTATSITSSELPIIQRADDNDSFNRICSALQNLITDAQVALQKPNSSSSHQLLELPQTTTRPRAQSWSSNVSSWIMNQYNPSPVVVCECGSCWLCLEPSSNNLSSSTTTTRTTPKSSRANSISSVQRPSMTVQKQESDKHQVLAGIKKQYRKKLERRFDYRKSCDDLENELQKLITTAISTGMEHGLMHSPVHCQYQFHDIERDDSSSTSDSYFAHKGRLHRHNYFRNHDDEETSDESYDESGEEKFSRFTSSFPKSFEIFCNCEQFKELESAVLNDNNNDNEKKSSKWRRRIWDCLQRMGLKFNNDNCNEKFEEEDEEDDNENSWYSSYSSYNSSWNSSSRDDRENSNEDSANPFPSSFINTLNIGQSIFNFNVNLINSTTNNYNNKTTNNYFNEIDNSIHTTSTTNNNNHYNCNTSINDKNHEEKLSQLNSAKEDFTVKRSTSKTSKYMNVLAMMGLMISMSQTILSKPTTTSSITSSFMNVAARNIIRSGAKGRRSGSDMILMIKVIKYVAVLFVGWTAGRIGKKQKESSDEK